MKFITGAVLVGILIALVLPYAVQSLNDKEVSLLIVLGITGSVLVTTILRVIYQMAFGSGEEKR